MEIIRMNRVLNHRLIASHAFIPVAFQTGNFQEGGKAVHFFLPCAFLGERGIPSQRFFFGGLLGLGGRT